jgi:hypothetical protein
MSRIDDVEGHALLFTSLSVAMLLIMVLFIGYFDILACSWLQKHAFGPLGRLLVPAVAFIFKTASGIKEGPSTSQCERQSDVSLSAQTSTRPMYAAALAKPAAESDIPTNGCLDARLVALGPPCVPNADCEWAFPLSDIELADAALKRRLERESLLWM